MRRRLTWEEDGLGKRASSELPDEGAASPAHQAEKGVEGYGMNSDFGSEPHSGPYGNGEHPATPDEGPASPAFKAAALERKAAKCIRIASAMLGDAATVAAVEDQALALMDLSDRAIQASLERLADDDDDDDDDDEEEVEEVEVEESKKKASSLEGRIARLERVLIRLAESEDPEGDGAKGSKDPRGEKDGAKGSEDPGEPNSEGKKAKDSMDEDMDEDDAAAAEGLDKKAEDEEEASEDEEGKKKADWQPGHRAPGGWDPGSEEAMLESMLEEEGMWGSNKHEYKRTDGHRDGDVDGHYKDYEGMWGSNKHEYKRTDGHRDGDVDGHYKDYEGMGHDEIGHIVHSDEMGMDDEMMMLAKLFDKSADIPAGEDKEEKEDHEKGAIADDKDHIKKLEKDEKEDKKDLKKDEKKAAELKPQPKKESTGATRLGGVTKAAKSEVNDLSKLWNSAPDVSKFF